MQIKYLTDILRINQYLKFKKHSGHQTEIIYKAMKSHCYQGHFTSSLYDNLLMKILLMDVPEKNLKQKFNIQHLHIIIIHMYPTELMLHNTSDSDQI